NVVGVHVRPVDWMPVQLAHQRYTLPSFRPGISAVQNLLREAVCITEHTRSVGQAQIQLRFSKETSSAEAQALWDSLREEADVAGNAVIPNMVKRGGGLLRSALHMPEALLRHGMGIVILDV